MKPDARRKARRRPTLVSGALIAAATAVTFALGVALGQALGENEPGGETQTSIRTLAPETLPAQTVTVTVTAR